MSRAPGLFMILTPPESSGRLRTHAQHRRFVSPWWCALGLILVGAVGCGGGARRNPDEGMTAFSDLPAEHQALVRLYGQGGPAWEQRRAELLGEPELANFLVDNLVREMVNAWDGSLLETQVGERGPFERAQIELAYLSKHSMPVLCEMLTLADDVVAFLCIDTLRKIGGQASLPVSELLSREDPEVRRRAAELLAGLGHGRSEEGRVRAALARAATADSSWLVRAQSARALGQRGARDVEAKPWRLALQAALGDSDPAVAAVAAEGLGVLGDPDGVPALVNSFERGMREGEFKIVTASQLSLSVLSGIDWESRAQWMQPRDWRDYWRSARIESQGDPGDRRP